MCIRDRSQWLSDHNVHNLEPELPGYARTAALVEQLDFVITVDTAICHLAAALGVPVAIMLSADPDWRWLKEGENSPWYPSATLLRQTEPGAWEPVLEQAVALLTAASQSETPKP